jgi:superfamily II DNA or RNA helicase
MLRGYQIETINAVRAEFAAGGRRICVCLPTGAGKSHIAGGLIRSILGKNPRARVWFCVPRLELISQTRNVFEAYGVFAGELSARAKDFMINVCVCSKDTLIRVENLPTPDFIFFDEAHVALEQQRAIAGRYPDAVVIGFTATPEIADGGPMMITRKNNQTLGLYDALVSCKSIPELQRLGVLSRLDYKSISAADAEKFGLLDKGLVEVSGRSLDAVLSYGDIVAEYEKYGVGKASIGFAPTIELADKCVEALNHAGYEWKRISGDMPLKRRAALISELVKGGIDGLVNAMLLTYGFDAPRVEYAFSIRHVRSKTLWVQMVGRVIRASPGKEKAVFCDLTGCCYNFADDKKPFFFNDEKPEWAFEGKKIIRCQFKAEYACVNRRKKKAPRCIWDALRLCQTPLYYFNPAYCGAGKTACSSPIEAAGEKEAKKEKRLEQMRMNIISVNTQYEIMRNFREGGIDGREAVARLLTYAETMGYHYMWAYWFINKGKTEADVQTLKDIGALKGFKPQWVFFKTKEIEEKLRGGLQKQA